MMGADQREFRRSVQEGSGTPLALGVNAEVDVYTEMEVFSNMESQIERAVQLGQDKIVQDLDREIDPVLEAILAYRAKNAVELQRQLKFITDLLARRAECPATVQRLSAKLAELVNQYFEDGQLRFRETCDVASFSMVPGRALAKPEEADLALSIARVAVISMDYRFLYCNAVLSEDLHVTPVQVIGRPISEVCNVSVVDTVYRSHLEMCMAGQFREFEAPCLTGMEGRPDYHVRLTPLRNIERRITGAVLVAQSGSVAMADLGV